jgi:hypothetical protein
MRTAARLAVALTLALSSSGCAAGAQTKAGAVLFFAGLGGLTAGVTVAVDHCSPSPDFCRSTAPARPDIGVPLIAAGSLALIAGGALVMTARSPPPEPAAPTAPAAPPPAPRRRSEWVSPL